MAIAQRKTIENDGAAPGSAPAEPYLRITGVTKMFGSFAALREVSFDIFEGELICFLGPSGCGKTTLLRAIAGLDLQTAGRIEQAGRDISALPPDQRDFGIVFQSYALFPNLTIYKNIAYGLENRRMNRAAINERVAELVALVGLEGEERKYPAQLSGGQQQRVALARALATSPGLLLLDEPLSALDARVRVHLRHEIRALQRRLGVTTVMVTHDQEEALTMADRIVVMNRGVIEQIGTPVDIYREPANAFVADFIGTMNFLPATAIGARRVRVGEIELDCAGRVAAENSETVTVSFRPEDVAVRGVGPGQTNSFEVRIEDIEFQGSFVRARLGRDELDGRTLLADFSINAVRDLDIAPGATLRIALPPERIHIFSAA